MLPPLSSDSVAFEACSDNWPNSRLSNTAPSAETPNAPPMLRENVAVEVATPSRE